MKKQLIIYGAIILIFIAYNLFFQLKDERMNTIINIIGASVIFGYIAYIALVLLRKTK